VKSTWVPRVSRIAAWVGSNASDDGAGLRVYFSFTAGRVSIVGQDLFAVEMTVCARMTFDDPVRRLRA